MTKESKKILSAQQKLKEYENRFGRPQLKMTTTELCKYYNLSGRFFAKFKKENQLYPTQKKTSRATGHVYHLWSPLQARKIGVLLHMDMRFLKMLGALAEANWERSYLSMPARQAPPLQKIEKPDITQRALSPASEKLKQLGAHMVSNNLSEIKETIAIVPIQARQILEMFEEDVEEEMASEETADGVRFKIYSDEVILEAGSVVLEGITKKKEKKDLSITFCV